MDSRNKRIREKYCVAFLVGTLPGLYLIGMAAYGATPGPWYLPNWDPQYVSDFRPEILEQLHKAIVLRFFAFLLESGCQFVFMPAVASCCLVKISLIAEKHPLLQCFTNAIWVFVKLFALLVVFSLLVGCFPTDSHTGILEILFHQPILQGFMLVWGFGSFIASSIYLFVSLSVLHQAKMPATNQ